MQQFKRKSTKCVLFSPKLVHMLPPSVKLWKLRFYFPNEAIIQTMDSRYKIILVYIKWNFNEIHLQDLRKILDNFSTNKRNSLIFTHDKYNIPTDIHT